MTLKAYKSLHDKGPTNVWTDWFYFYDPKENRLFFTYRGKFYHTQPFSSKICRNRFAEKITKAIIKRSIYLGEDNLDDSI